MHRLLPIAKKVSFVLLVAIVVTYFADFCWFRYRVWKPRPNDPFESVKLDHYYAITQKNNRIDFEPAPSETVTCVHTIFPHAGHNPCWYVARQNGKPISLTLLPYLHSRP